MIKKRITAEGIDEVYTFYVALVSDSEIEAIAGKKCGATFINNIAYFADTSDECVAHESLHVTFEYIRKTNLEDSLGDMLDDKTEARVAGEEGVVYSFTEIHGRIKDAIKSLHESPKGDL